MVLSDILAFNGPSLELSFRVRLLRDENPNVVDNLLSVLPLESFLLHVVVAGETIYLPAPTFSLSSKHMVKRTRGTVYYNTTSQSICICYGAVTESTPVNQFAQVLEDDLPHLSRLGKLVYDQTISRHVPRIFKISVESPDRAFLKPSQGTLTPPLEKSDGSWRMVKDLIDKEVLDLRRPEEPDEIQMIRLGVVKSRSAGDGSPFQTIIFLQGFLSTLCPHVFSRLLTISNYPEITLPLMIRQTREFLTETFNHFDFLADLGLTRVERLGKMYATSLDSLTTLQEYRILTDSIRTLIQLLYRWLHLVFPWYLKDQFKGRTPEEVVGMPKLEIYSARSDY